MGDKGDRVIIAELRGFDCIKQHLADCDYHAVVIEEVLPPVNNGCVHRYKN